MCCSYTKNPMHSPEVAVGAPLVSGGPWVTAGTGGNSEQAYSRWQRSALDPGPGVRVTKLFHFHLFTAGSPQHPFRLEDFFFLLPTKHSKSWMAYCLLQGPVLQHQLQMSPVHLRDTVQPQHGNRHAHFLSSCPSPAGCHSLGQRGGVQRLRFSTAPHCSQLQPQQSLPHVSGVNCRRWATAWQN